MQIRKLSVVVPVRNEEDNITPLIAEICTALDGVVDYEIIYVNDGSTDATRQRLAEIRKTCPQLRVIRHEKSCGQSTAVRSGVKAAKGDWIATLDGDGQNDPADIPRLIAALESGVELVGGNRRHARRDTWIKRISSVIANGVRSRMLNDSTPDTGCGLKLFSREVFLDLPYFDHMHRFFAGTGDPSRRARGFGTGQPSATGARSFKLWHFGPPDGRHRRSVRCDVAATPRQAAGGF